jgi:hypothetical protein
MATKGIKLKLLARELGLTSRQLIDRCRAEGVAVQNSITRLPADIEAIVRGWFRHAPGESSPSPEKAPNGAVARPRPDSAKRHPPRS